MEVRGPSEHHGAIEAADGASVSVEPATATAFIGLNSPARIVAVDLARFLAIVGMIATHLMFLPPTNAVVEPIYGFPSTLFALIGGVSAVLSTRRFATDGQHLAAALSLVGRGVIVALIGVVLSLPPGLVVVVLVYFGVALICASPFLRVPARALIIVAGALALTGPFLNLAVRAAADLDTIGELSLAGPFEFLYSVFFTGTYPVVTWLVYVLVGMAVGKLVLAATAEGRASRFAIRMTIAGAVMAAIATLIDALSRGFVIGQLVDASALSPDLVRTLLVEGFGGPVGSGWVAVVNATPHTGSVGDIVRTLGVSLVILGVLLLTTQRLSHPLPLMLRPIATAGAAPLTIYSVHVLATIMTTIVSMTFFDLSEPEWWFNGLGILGIHIAGVLAIGAILAAIRRRGPLETFTTWVARHCARLGVRWGSPRR